MKVQWHKPIETALNAEQKAYINPVPQGNIPKMLQKSRQQLLNTVKELSHEKLCYRYAPGKWTIPDIIMHLADCERVHTYRILSLSRGDTAPLPGFDENLFAKAIDTSKIDFKKVLDEYKAVRKATLYLLTNLTEEMYLRKGIANNRKTSVQEIAYSMLGHELHHTKIIKERYLSPVV